jgi:hypothetical protein
MALRLRTRHRWCVTGTPVGARGADDLHGLLVFLRHVCGRARTSRLAADAVHRDSADQSDRSASLTLNLGLIALPMQSADRLCITLLMQSTDSEQ